MLRGTLQKCYSSRVLTRPSCPRHRSRSLYSSNKSSSSLGKIAAIGAIGGAACVGAAIAYAKHNNDFRKRLENNVPYSSLILKTLIGPTKPDPLPLRPKPPSTPSPSTSQKKDDPTPPSLLNRKLERETNKSTDNSSSTSKLPPVPPPAIDVVTSNSTKDEDRKPKEVARVGATKSSESSGTVNPLSGLSPEYVKSVNVDVSKETTTTKKGPIDINQLPPEIQETLVNQLKHQLSAFNDYLKEQLQLQADELSRLHHTGLEEKVLEEKLKYQRELASSIVRLQEVDRILAVRQQLDEDEKHLRQIWFLCQQLNDCLKSNPSAGIENKPHRIITTEILPTLEKMITTKETTPVIKLALQTIQSNQDITKRGVFTEDALISRFDKVDRICRRVALIPNEGGSLWQYMLSYAQSLLLIDTKEISKDELSNEPIDVTKLDTFALLTRVRHHLKNRNLEMSLRYANQLKGESRRAASDGFETFEHISKYDKRRRYFKRTLRLSVLKLSTIAGRYKIKGYSRHT